MMETKTLKILFIVLIMLAFLFIVALAAISDAAHENSDFSKITGSLESFEIVHDSKQNYAPTKKNPERYDEKLIDYKDHLEERRDDTFLR